MIRELQLGNERRYTQSDAYEQQRHDEMDDLRVILGEVGHQ